MISFQRKCSCLSIFLAIAAVCDRLRNSVVKIIRGIIMYAGFIISYPNIKDDSAIQYGYFVAALYYTYYCTVRLLTTTGNTKTVLMVVWSKSCILEQIVMPN